MQQMKQPMKNYEQKYKQRDIQDILDNQGRFGQKNCFKEIFQKDLDQEQKQILDKEKVYDLADFFYKIEKSFFKYELDQEIFEFFKFLSVFLKMDEEKLIPILKKLHVNKLYSQQAFTQVSDFTKIGIEQQIIEKIQNEIIKRMPISQNSSIFQEKSPVHPPQIKQLEKQTQNDLISLKKQCSQPNQNYMNGQDKKLYGYPIYDHKKLGNLNDYKTILVIGQKGCGKSSFLNYLLNIYLGVAQEDDFRFIFQNSYQPLNSRCVRYVQQFRGKSGLKLIDTPGFNEDLYQNQTNSDQNFLSYLEIGESIDCICLVLDANITRLNSAQKLFFNQVVRNFGNQIFSNLKFIFNQCTLDGEVPKSMQAIKFKGDEYHEESPFAKYLNLMTTPIYFKVNCQNFHSQNVSQELQNYYWNMTYQNISDFYVDMFSSQKKSIKFTDFLQKEQQEKNIQNLLDQTYKVKAALKENKNKLNQIQQSTPTYDNLKGKTKLEEQDKIKRSISQQDFDFSICLYKTKKAIQNYYEIYYDKTKTVIEYTEEIKGKINKYEKNEKRRKIMINNLERIQNFILMEDYARRYS